MLETKTRKIGSFKILNYPDENLLIPCEEVIRFDSKIKNTIERMYSFLNDGAIGLAANQIGLRAKIFVFKLPGEYPQHIINPSIIDLDDDDEVVDEQCLSFPGYLFKVRRSKSCKIEGKNCRGKEIIVPAKELRSQLFQHEVDHLNGEVVIDKAIDFIIKRT